MLACMESEAMWYLVSHSIPFTVHVLGPCQPRLYACPCWYHVVLPSCTFPR